MPVNQSQAVLQGDRLALTRVLSQVENNTSKGDQLLEELFPHTGKAKLVGITGAPGTGKSTLVNRLAFEYRHPPAGLDPPTIAIVAVDPSSPFSGGALLGDRVRMHDLAGDPGVFVRSMASRGSLGGLATTTASLVQVFDAAGFDIILIETVGAGQAEVDIARLAHTTVVVEAPGLGDDIQTIKAGILEIADILVVNKADKPGAENAVRALRNMLSLSQPDPGSVLHHGEMMEVSTITNPPGDSWVPPIISTISTTGKGIPELIEGLRSHQQYLEESGGLKDREIARLRNEVENLLQRALRTHWNASISKTEYQKILELVTQRKISPRIAVERLLEGAGL